jgi:GlpG protein
MRQVATFEDERSARLFADVLCARAIDTEVSRARSGSWDVWVHEEKHVEASRAAYAAFDANPSAAEHLEAAGCVEKKARQQVVVERKSRHEVIDVRRRFPGGDASFGKVSIGLVLASVALTLIVYYGHRVEIGYVLSVGGPTESRPFEDVLRGQLWRLVTPIFLHQGALHLLFNMWWLVDLGSALESRLGPVRYLGIVLFSAVLSNAAQYALVGPAFGGMSGVLYALFGYLWVRGRLDTTFGLAMPNGTAVALMVWLVLGFVGVIGNVANVCHIGGLVVGAALGALASVRARRA